MVYPQKLESQVPELHATRKPIGIEVTFGWPIVEFYYSPRTPGFFSLTSRPGCCRVIPETFSNYQDVSRVSPARLVYSELTNAGISVKPSPADLARQPSSARTHDGLVKVIRELSASRAILRQNFRKRHFNFDFVPVLARFIYTHRRCDQKVMRIFELRAPHPVNRVDFFFRAFVVVGQLRRLVCVWRVYKQDVLQCVCGEVFV